jgi:hypothetical protein
MGIRSHCYVAVLVNHEGMFKYQIMKVVPRKRGWYKLEYAMGLVNFTNRRTAMRLMKKEVEQYRSVGHRVFIGDTDTLSETKE